MRKNLVLRPAWAVPAMLLVATPLAACSGPGAGVHTATGHGVLAPTTLDASAPTTDDRACCGVFRWPEDLPELPSAPPPEGAVEHSIGTIAASPSTTAPPTTASPPITVPPDPATELVQLAQLRAAGLLITADDLGPEWVVEDDSAEDDGGAAGGVGEGLLGAPSGSGPERTAYEQFVACAAISSDLLAPALASVGSPTFVAGTLHLSSSADVFADPAVVSGQLDLFRSDRGARCFADMLGSLMGAGLGPDGSSVTSSKIHPIEHPLLAGRGFVYDWVVEVKTSRGPWSMESFVVGLADGNALAWVSLFGVGKADRPIVDDLVELLDRKARVD
jgi:hypothetical protein